MDVPWTSKFTSIRTQVAREAATLLYTSQEKEYKQAKEKAAKIQRVRVLPSNFEVALELDKIAEEHEGPHRQKMLINLRKEALKIMETLNGFHPKLVGSVWRGTAHRNSDVDIIVYAYDPKTVTAALQTKKYKIASSQWSAVTKNGTKKNSCHIIIPLSPSVNAELIVKAPEKAVQVERCEIYGDPLIGLKPSKLRDVLRGNPLQKFIPPRTFK